MLGDGWVGMAWWLKGDAEVRCLGLWVGVGRVWVGISWWFEGAVGECESWHIPVIDTCKCIIHLCIQVFNSKKS